MTLLLFAQIIIRNTPLIVFDCSPQGAGIVIHAYTKRPEIIR